MSEYVIPTDTDLPNTRKVIRQVDCQYQFGDEAAIFTIKLAGETSAVVATAANYRKGSRIVWSDFKSKFDELKDLNLSGIYSSGKVTSSTSTTKQGSAQAAIVVQIPYENKIGSSEGAPDGPKKYKTVTWSEKSTQYEFPLGAYAGSSRSASAINAGDFEAWKNMKTTDITKYKNFQFDLSGATWDLQGMTLELAKKWYKGIEAVDRAYPEVIRTTNYYNYKGDELTVTKKLIDNLSVGDPKLFYIDSTPSAVWDGLFPNTSWLKSAFDVDTQPTEYNDLWNVTVTEAWIGINTIERGEWDKNLYGPDPIQLDADHRWPFADVTGSEPEPPSPDFPPLPDEDDPDYEEKIMTTWIQYTNNRVEGIDAEGTWNGSAIAEDKVSTILQIDLGQAVTGIASNAFYGYPNLRTVYVPTTVATIAENAFLSGPIGVSFIDRTLDEISAMTNYPWGIDPEHIEIYE